MIVLIKMSSSNQVPRVNENYKPVENYDTRRGSNFNGTNYNNEMNIPMNAVYINNLDNKNNINNINKINSLRSVYGGGGPPMYKRMIKDNSNYSGSTKKTLWVGELDKIKNEMIDENYIMYSMFYEFTQDIIKIKLCKEKHPPNSSYAFIEFTNSDIARHCFNNLNGKWIPGSAQRFKLNWAKFNLTENNIIQKQFKDNNNMNPNMIPLELDHRGTYYLYVGNLHSNTTKEDIESLFCNMYKSVCHIRMMKNGNKNIHGNFKHQGINKIYCFVHFMNYDECARAINEMNGFFFKGLKLKVSKPNGIKTNMNNGIPHTINGVVQQGSKNPIPYDDYNNTTKKQNYKKKLNGTNIYNSGSSTHEDNNTFVNKRNAVQGNHNIIHSGIINGIGHKKNPKEYYVYSPNETNANVSQLNHHPHNNNNSLNEPMNNIYKNNFYEYDPIPPNVPPIPPLNNSVMYNSTNYPNHFSCFPPDINTMRIYEGGEIYPNGNYNVPVPFSNKADGNMIRFPIATDHTYLNPMYAFANNTMDYNIGNVQEMRNIHMNMNMNMQNFTPIQPYPEHLPMNHMNINHMNPVNGTNPNFNNTVCNMMNIPYSNNTEDINKMNNEDTKILNGNDQQNESCDSKEKKEGTDKHIDVNITA